MEHPTAPHPSVDAEQLQLLEQPTMWDDLLMATADLIDGTVGGDKPARRGGRRAVPASLINLGRNRAVTFCKRRKGLFRKVFQAQQMTHCNVFLLVQQVPGARPVNNYAYGCDTWRTAFFSDVVCRLLSLAQPVRYDDADRISGGPFAPVEAYRTEGVVGSETKITPIADQNSPSKDQFCSIKLGVSTRNRGGVIMPHVAAPRGESSFAHNLDNQQPQAPFGVFEDPNDVLLDDELDRALAELPQILDIEEEANQRPLGQHDPPVAEGADGSRKRGPVSIRYIDDPKKCSTSFCKRKAGVMRKAFELTAMTGCNCILVLSCATKPGQLPNLFHVYASPLWRNSQELSELVTLLRMGQEAGLHPDAPDQPVERYMEALGRPGELQQQLTQMYSNYIMPAAAGDVKYVPIDAEDADYSEPSCVFKWRWNGLAAGHHHIAASGAGDGLDGGVTQRKRSSESSTDAAKRQRVKPVYHPSCGSSYGVAATRLDLPAALLEAPLGSTSPAFEDTNVHAPDPRVPISVGDALEPSRDEVLRLLADIIATAEADEEGNRRRAEEDAAAAAAADRDAAIAATAAKAAAKKRKPTVEEPKNFVQKEKPKDKQVLNKKLAASVDSAIAPAVVVSTKKKQQQPAAPKSSMQRDVVKNALFM